MFRDMMRKVIEDFLWSLPGMVIDHIGWGGVAALVAGSVLLLSLSARAVKWMTSPRAMVVAAIALIAFVMMWGTGPKVAKTASAASPAAPKLTSHKAIMPPAAKPTQKAPPKPKEVELAVMEALPLMAVAPTALPIASAVIPPNAPHATSSPVGQASGHAATHQSGHQAAHVAASQAHPVVPMVGTHLPATVTPPPSTHAAPSATSHASPTVSLATNAKGGAPHTAAPSNPPTKKPKPIPAKPKPVAINNGNGMQGAQSPSFGIGGGMGNGHSNGHAVSNAATGPHRANRPNHPGGYGAFPMFTPPGVGYYPMGGMHPGYGNMHSSFGAMPMGGMHSGGGMTHAGGMGHVGGHH